MEKVLITVILVLGLFCRLCSTVEMCSNKAESAQTIFLSHIQDDISTNSDCFCSVKSTTGKETKVTFKLKEISTACQYKLSVSYKTIRSYFECNIESPELFYTIQGSEEIKLYFEPTSDTGAVEFAIDISSIINITISCYSLSKHLTTVTIPTTFTTTTFWTSTAYRPTQAQTLPAKSSTIFTSTSERSRVDNTPTPPVTTITSNRYHTSPVTNITPSRYTTSYSYTPTSTSPMSETGLTNFNQSDVIAASIGCLIAGIIIGVISVFGIKWLLKKRKNKEKDEIYTSPEIGMVDSHTYSSISSNHETRLSSARLPPSDTTRDHATYVNTLD